MCANNIIFPATIDLYVKYSILHVKCNQYRKIYEFKFIFDKKVIKKPITLFTDSQKKPFSA